MARLDKEGLLFTYPEWSAMRFKNYFPETVIPDLIRATEGRRSERSEGAHPVSSTGFPLEFTPNLIRGEDDRLWEKREHLGNP